MLKKVVSRSTIFATIMALALASLSATSVFAAGLMHRTSEARRTDLDLASQWKTELADLKSVKFTDSSIGKWTTEWLETKRSTADIHSKDRYVERAAIDLRLAEAIAAKHAGFNAKGDVIDRALATQTIQSLTRDINAFHMDLMDKIRALFS
jgi:hypothetical protein